MSDATIAWLGAGAAALGLWLWKHDGASSRSDDAPRPTRSGEVFALLVNPRNGEPFYAKLTRGEVVSIHTLADDELGQGFFHSPKNPNSYNESSLVSGYPRVHTPAGVREKGTGLGTVLYAALCTAAHQQHADGLPVHVAVSGDGVSSNAHRSAFAEAWWTRARTQFHLVRRVHGCVEKSARGGRVRKRCGVAADVFPYAAAVKHHLVVASVKRGCRRWGDVKVGDVDYVVAPATLRALNLGVLRDPKRYAPARGAAVADFLIELARRHGASAQALASMRARYERGVDIEVAPDAPRRNPGRALVVRPKFYGPRANPAAAALPRELAALHKARARLGWDAWASDAL